MVVCSTIGHEHRRAMRLVTCEGDGSFPYCGECAALLVRGGETDVGGVAEAPRYAHEGNASLDVRIANGSYVAVDGRGLTTEQAVEAVCSYLPVIPRG